MFSTFRRLNVFDFQIQKADFYAWLFFSKYEASSVMTYAATLLSDYFNSKTTCGKNRDILLYLF